MSLLGFALGATRGVGVLYHVIQAGALYRLFVGARWLVATRGVPQARC